MKNKLTIYVENSPTILSRLIQTVKAKRINISLFNAEESSDSQDGVVNMTMETDPESLKKIKSKFEKLVDVIHVECENVT